MTDEISQRLNEIYTLLYRHFGPLHWWPAESPFEVAIGAILTQNTAWLNVEKAIRNLRNSSVMTPRGLVCLQREQLETLIRPAGFFRQKAERLQCFAQYLCDCHGGRIEPFLIGDLDVVRAALLKFKGIGPETADAILLYAGEHPSFVVDAYTRRLFVRLGVIQGNESYENIRRLFMSHLNHDTKLFNEYHALIVEQSKQFCHKRNPDCCSCPLRTLCIRQ